MKSFLTWDQPGALKDEDAAHPVAGAWRETFREVVRAFAEGDYALARAIRSVAPLSAETAAQIEAYLSSYGETLVELPDEAWGSSIAQWMGSHWDVLVDLWTSESGASDLVLSARVFERGSEGELLIEIDSVHVP